MRFRNFPASLTILLTLCWSSLCLAQRLSLWGTVTDAETGRPLPDANVIVRTTDGEFGTATSNLGEFRFFDLQAGTLEIVVSFIGYQNYEHELELAAGRSPELLVALQPGSILFNPVSISASRRPEKALDAPAAISVLEAGDLVGDVAPSSADLLRNVTGVDIATTGIDRREMVLRGFNNAFSGSAYILTDYRRAAVPSLDVNLHSIMPSMSTDLERVEIVRGPGSALYGAGVDAGVIHYITKGPARHPGTSLSLTTGERSTMGGEFRHAGVISRLGYKVTAQFAQADDWELDPADSLDANQLDNDFQDPDSGERLQRDNDYRKFNMNGMLQYQFSDDVTLKGNAGYSTLDATILSAIGTLQADGFGYSYGQLRFQSGHFFAQGYLNRNQAGDSFIYGFGKSDSGKSIIDNSVFLNLQAQYDLELWDEREQLTFGVDYDRTTPKTGGTIFGDYEDQDLISQLGIYGQSQTEVSDKLDLTAALRVDYNNIEERVQLSPRVAVVYKPTPKHAFRATYNRAYALPSTTSLFLDITAAQNVLSDGFTILSVGRGSAEALTFDDARSGNGITAHGLLPSVNDNGYWTSDVTYAGGPGAIAEASVPMASIYSVLHYQLTQLPVNAILDSLRGRGIQTLDSSSVAAVLGQLSPQNINIKGYADSQLDFMPMDIEPLKATITHSLEAGYKGLLGDRVLLAVDAYYSQRKNFVSGNTQVTPFALLPQDAAGFNRFKEEFQSAISDGISGNPLLNFVLALSGISPDTVASVIVDIAEENLRTLPVAVVQPDQNQDPGVVLGGYRNYGDVDFWGADASIHILANDNLTLFGNLSYVSDDFFDNAELGESSEQSFLALNATRFKAKGGFRYQRPNGIALNASARFTKAFPVASGPYIGGLPIAHSDDAGGLRDYFLLDVGCGYDLSGFAVGMRLDLTVQNILNHKHREFIGAPRIGRLALVRLGFSL